METIYRKLFITLLHDKSSDQTALDYIHSETTFIGWLFRFTTAIFGFSFLPYDNMTYVSNFTSATAPFLHSVWSPHKVFEEWNFSISLQLKIKAKQYHLTAYLSQAPAV